MREQVRLWFYSMLFMGVTLHGRAPYEKVLTHERVISEDGTPFSKTGHMINFNEAAGKMGVDTMRYYFASQDPGNELRFGYTVGDESRKKLLSFWNICMFFKTYADLDKPNLKEEIPGGQLTFSDHWLLARLNLFIDHATSAYENQNTPSVIREFESFTEDVSFWYVRMNRRRFWQADLSEDKLVAYRTLFQAIKTTTILMAPIIPFITDYLWQNCIRTLDDTAALSVHLEDWQPLDGNWENIKILRQCEIMQKVLNMALRLRNQANIKVRQPLLTLYVVGKTDVIEASKATEEYTRNELNVKQIEYPDNPNKLKVEYVELDRRKAGRVLRENLSRVEDTLKNLSPKEMESVLKMVKDNKEVELPGHNHVLSGELFKLTYRPKPNVVLVEENDITLALDTTITDELMYEGWVRDILRHIQVLRKDTGLKVEDKIYLALKSSSAEVNKAISKYTDLIKSDTLAEVLLQELDNPLGYAEICLGNFIGY